MRDDSAAPLCALCTHDERERLVGADGDIDGTNEQCTRADSIVPASLHETPRKCGHGGRADVDVADAIARSLGLKWMGGQVAFSRAEPLCPRRKILSTKTPASTDHECKRPGRIHVDSGWREEPRCRADAVRRAASGAPAACQSRDQGRADENHADPKVYLVRL